MIDSNGPIAKRLTAISLLREHRAVVVALSGGVDSATLLALACEALGADRVLAVTARSESVTEREIEDARRVASTLGVRHEVVETHEVDRAGYRANAGDRCFHCRTELFEVLSTLAVGRGFETIVYGAIVDDLGDDRPGMLAAAHFGIRAPLMEAGICKNDVRILAKMLDMHVHDKPANACLASRIPKGREVTPDALRQVGEAEAAVRDLGFRQFRVRHHGEIARLEFGEDEFARLESATLRSSIVAAVKRAGFRFVAMDLEGYRPGGSPDPSAGGRLYRIDPIRETGQ